MVNIEDAHMSLLTHIARNHRDARVEKTRRRANTDVMAFSCGLISVTPAIKSVSVSLAFAP